MNKNLKYNSPEMRDMISGLTRDWTNYYAFDDEEFQLLLTKIQGVVCTTTPDRLCILYQLVKQYINYPAAELGVFQGATAYIIAYIIKKLIYLYDTFDGLPDVSEKDEPKQHIVSLYPEGFLKADFEDVQLFLKDFDNILFFKGEFPDSACDLEQGLGLVHLDCDLYEGTKAGLEYFHPRMISRGTILIDDYGCNKTLGVKKAVDEFLLNKNDLFLSLGTGQGLIIKN